MALIGCAMLVALPIAGCTAGAAPSPQADKTAGGSAAKVSGDANAGKQLFVSRGCIACHVAPGVPGATGTIGPNLTGVGDAQKKPQLADGSPNAPENLRAWIKDPASRKPGTMMPNLNLSDKDSDDLVAFLLTLK